MLVCQLWLLLNQLLSLSSFGEVRVILADATYMTPIVAVSLLLLWLLLSPSVTDAAIAIFVFKILLHD